MQRLWTPWRLAYVTESSYVPPSCIFCDALAHYCQDEEARAAAGRAGEMASRHFGWDEVNQELIDAYIRIIRQHGEGGRQIASGVP